MRTNEEGLCYARTDLRYIESEPNVDYQEIFLQRVKMPDELVDIVQVYRQPNSLHENDRRLNNLKKKLADKNHKLIILKIVTIRKLIRPISVKFRTNAVVSFLWSSKGRIFRSTRP